MDNFTYNDMQFSVQADGKAWNLLRALPGGGSAVVGTGLFAGLAANEVPGRALTLVKTIYPVGVKIVGPDVAHATRIGDLRIVGPDVTHPNFIYWDKDSVSDTVSCPQQP